MTATDNSTPTPAVALAGLPADAALGRQVTAFEGLDTFPAPTGVGRVVLRSQEVTALCPVTGQPDWYEVVIAYMPAERCLESKSVKLYLQAFRNAGIFAEGLAQRIAKDTEQALVPRALGVRVSQTPRGGVGLVAEAGNVYVLPPAGR